ncbi:hypothetical protein WH43_10950 [Rheinheimera sp. KL1]|uniref:glycosyltransferase n=1 Tax=Rheinheimera sp. KL1 TaxID=1635005 RepID=UPI0006A9BC2F|nr:glycosyltransferase [Rheinheimera sp. KL1]KOO58271.1 hypothetical protein WH43_10950 [Rheinheimera sp. KL1]
MIISIITQMEAAGAQGAMIRLHKRFMLDGFDSKAVFLYKKRDVYSNIPNVVCMLDHQPKGIFDYIKIFFRLFQFISKNKGAKLVCFTHYANIIGGVIGRLAGASKIVISHRNPVESYPRAARFFDKVIGYLGLYNEMICVSQAVVDSFSNYPQRYRKKLNLVLNGIDTPTGYSAKEFEWIKKPDKVTLVTTGRLHPQKNQKILIDAIKDFPNLSLYIAGDGELREEFEGYIRDMKLGGQVALLGELPPDKVYSFLSNGDVFVFPSSWEAFGFSVVEAMAIGLPVIASDIPAMKEIVGESGILIGNNNIDNWRLVFSDLSEGNFNLKKYSNYSLEKAKRYSLDVMYKQYKDLISGE